MYVQLKVYSWWNTKRFSSPRQHKEGGGSCALEDKYLADATRRVLDFVLILSRYAVTRTNIYIYIYIEKRNIETCLFLKGRRERKEGKRDKVYFNFKITCTIHAEKECTLRAKVRRIYLIKVFELKNV